MLSSLNGNGHVVACEASLVHGSSRSTPYFGGGTSLPDSVRVALRVPSLLAVQHSFILAFPLDTAPVDLLYQLTDFACGPLCFCSPAMLVTDSTGR